MAHQRSRWDTIPGNNQMATAQTILRQASSQIDQECSYISRERSAFRGFRECVRLAQPEQGDACAHSETTEELREAYRRDVMEALDHAAVYDESLAESLAEELSPALSDALLSNEPFTQRRKRDLLVASTEAIDRRERFREALDDERDSLKTTADELSEIEAAIDTLPELAPQHQPLEMLIVIWEGYETVEESCAELLADRQRQLEGTDQSIRRYGTTHALNRYLYGNLESVYPVLSALAATLRLLDSKRNREASPEVAEGSL